MNKFSFTLLDEYLSIHGKEHDKSKINLWVQILKTTKDVLKINEVKLNVFEHYDKAIEEALKGYSFKKVPANYNNHVFIMNIDDYIDFIIKKDDRSFYSNYYEDPEFYSGNEKKLEAISHEYCIFFYINGKEKKEIEKKLGIKLDKKPKIID